MGRYFSLQLHNVVEGVNILDVIIWERLCEIFPLLVLRLVGFWVPLNHDTRSWEGRKFSNILALFRSKTPCF